MTYVVARVSNSNMAETAIHEPRKNGIVPVSIGTKPTLIVKDKMKFLITDAPRQANLPQYIRELGKHHVTDVVRVCEQTYLVDDFTSAGIRVHELEYKDGTSPPKNLILSWLQLVEKTFYGGGGATGTVTDGSSPTIAVHCIAGLGRAPVMVALALIEFANMDPVDAVKFIRDSRRGAINEKQLLYLEGYKKEYKRSGGADTSCCVIL